MGRRKVQADESEVFLLLLVREANVSPNCVIQKAKNHHFLRRTFAFFWIHDSCCELANRDELIAEMEGVVVIICSAEDIIDVGFEHEEKFVLLLKVLCEDGTLA